MELGGKSPNIVFGDADLETAIPGAANAIFFNHGQCCCAGSRLYVQKKIFDEVVDGVTEHAKNIKLAEGFNPESQMGPLVSEEQLNRVLGFLGIGEGRWGKNGSGRQQIRRSGLFRRTDDSHRSTSWDEGRRRRNIRPGRLCDAL